MNDRSDQTDDSHTYEAIDREDENFYMTIKSPVEPQKPSVANHYVVEPVNPPSAAVTINERPPFAPPRSKDAKKSTKIKSATLPNPKKSIPPYRPPPPKFTSTASAIPSSPNSNKASPTDSISAPPRRKKSVAEEPVYEAPIVNQLTSVSSDTVKEPVECYVEMDILEEPAEYVDICELPSAADGNNNEPKTTENSASTNTTASKEDDKEVVTVKPAVTDVAKTGDENLLAHDSLNQKTKEPADSAVAKEEDQNLTILQAKKMFEAKPQSSPGSNKVTSPISKVIKTGSGLESTNKTKPATAEQKPDAKDSSNVPSSVDNDLPPTPIQPESMAPKQEESSNMANNKPEENAANKNKGSKNLILVKPSKPPVANVNGGNQ